MDAFVEGRLGCVQDEGEVVDRPERFAVDAGQDGTAEVTHGLVGSSVVQEARFNASGPVAGGPHRPRGASVERHGGERRGRGSLPPSALRASLVTAAWRP
nr:hypothetical protein GCM10017745_48630 [Saccharothrix mutabilis subsp. capreolus]